MCLHVLPVSGFLGESRFSYQAFLDIEQVEDM